MQEAWSTGLAFLAVLQNERVVAWGSGFGRGDIIQNGVEERLEQGKVEHVWSSVGASLVAQLSGQVLAATTVVTSFRTV